MTWCDFSRYKIESNALFEMATPLKVNCVNYGTATLAASALSCRRFVKLRINLNNKDHMKQRNDGIKPNSQKKGIIVIGRLA